MNELESDSSGSGSGTSSKLTPRAPISSTTSETAVRRPGRLWTDAPAGAASLAAMNARATSRASCSWQAPPYGNPVGSSGGRGQHCRGRCGGHPLVAADPVDGVRAQADTRDAVLGEVHAGALLVGALEHAVECARRGRIAPVRRERRDRRGVDDRPEPAFLRCLEHVHRPHDVHPGAEQRVGSHERNLEGRQVDDPADLVPGDRGAEGRGIRDVTLNVRNRV